MRSLQRIAAVGLLLSLALLTGLCFAQTLSVVRVGRNEARVDAVPSAGSGYALLESRDLWEWSDVVGHVLDRASWQVDLTEGSTRFFRLIQWSEPPPPIILALIGDSTIREYQEEWNFSGWGGGIPAYLRPEAQVVNLGWPCTSTKAFLPSEQKARMMLIKPDFVVIQFGLIDLTGCPDRDLTTTLQQYADNLKTIVELVRSFNGVPILVTPVAPRIFGTDGRVFPMMDKYSAAMRQAAEELQADFVDLHQSSLSLFNELGDSGSTYITAGKDLYHFSVKGAEVVAGLVIKELPESLRPYITRRP